MSYLMQSKVLTIVGATILATSALAKEAKEKCKSSYYREVYVCESDSSYRFVTPNREYIYRKSDWKNEVWSRVSDFMTEKKVNRKDFYYADVQVFLSVKASDPNQVGLRVQVEGNRGFGNKVLMFSDVIDVDAWDMTDAAVLDPKDGFYPENFGYVATELFVVPNKGVSEEAVRAFVEDMSLSLNRCSFGSLLSYCIVGTRVFNEKVAAEKIRAADDEEIFRSVGPNGIVEWEGWRTQFFSYQTSFFGFRPEQ